MANPLGLTFSKTFGLKLDGAEEWFDPCVWLDSPLCVDPFLMLDLETNDEFKGAHDEIVGFFQRQVNRVAAGGTNMDSPAIKAVRQALHMPEASELYLGYSEGVKGAGSGPGLAKLMAGAMMSAVAYGLTDIKHFEEISILGDGIGPDRISDAAAGITKWRFAQYTERICTQLNVPVQKRILDRAKYDLDQDRWVAVEAKLPINPRTKRPILLTPQRFLRHLPTLGSDEFAAYAERKWKYDHRESLDKKLVTFDKEKVFAAARKDPAIRNGFLTLAAKSGGKPYDFNQDKWGVKLTDSAESIVADHPFQYKQPTSDKEMKAFVVALAKYFKHFIEEQKDGSCFGTNTTPSRRRRCRGSCLESCFRFAPSTTSVLTQKSTRVVDQLTLSSQAVSTQSAYWKRSWPGMQNGLRASRGSCPHTLSQMSASMAFTCS